MLAILPVLCFSIIVFVQRLYCPWRMAIINGAVIWGGILALLTEGLSLFNAISKTSLIVCWLLITVLFSIYFFRKINISPQQFFGKIQFKPSYGNFIIIITLVSVLLLLFFTAWVYPPNNYDSMTYHMSRVVHWIQNHNVNFFPTHSMRQLYQSPFAEYNILHFQILSNGDWVANFIQYFSMIGSLIGVTLIAKQFNINRYGQLLAVLFCVSIPMGILQSTTTQNDYVLTFWLVCFVFYILQFFQQESLTTTIYLGISLGLAILTKSTSYFFAFPFLIWLIIVKFSSLNKQTIRYLTITALIVIILNLGVYTRNINYFSNPLGPGREGANSVFSNEVFTPAAVLSNIIRNTTLHLSTMIPGANEYITKKIDSFHNYLGISVDDPRTTWYSTTFNIPIYKFHEDIAGNFFHFLTIILCLVLFALQKNKPKNMNIYLLCLGLGFVLLCIVLKWQPWNSRLHLPLFVLFAPCFSFIATQNNYRNAFYILSLILIMAAYPYVIYNESKPLYNIESIFKSNRIDRYFINKKDEKDSYINATAYLLNQDCTNIGLIINGDDWEYPIWALLHTGTSEEIILEHVAVNNVSINALQKSSSNYTQDNLCALFVISENPPDSYVISGSTYHQNWSEDKIDIYLKDITDD